MNKKILIIFTGGTISMKNDTLTKKAHIINNSNHLIDEIRDALGAIEIEKNELLSVPSPAITPNDMFTLAKLIDESVNRNDITGIVVTHGTDTLEETAFFIDQVINSKKPIVFTGAMRNNSELGFDGISNLVSSIHVASSDDSNNRGVLVVLNDEINSAYEVTKTNTVALNTFKSVEFGPLGIVDHSEVLYYRKIEKGLKKLPKRLETSVEIVKAYSGSGSNILKFLVDNGCKGIIVEALGIGNIPPLMVPGIKYAIDKGVAIGLATRCISGRVYDAYDYDGGGSMLKEMGVIFFSNVNSVKARILLMLKLST